MNQCSVSARDRSERDKKSLYFPRRKVSDAFVTLLYLFTAFSLITVVVSAGLAPAQFDPQASAFIYGLGAFGGLLASVFSRRAGANQVVISFFFFVFIALPALVQVRTDVFPFKSTYSSFELNSGFFLVAVGHLCYLVGIAVFLSRNLRDANTKKEFDEAPAHEPNVSADLAKIAICLALIALMIGLIAGPSSLFTARFENAASPSSGEKFGEQLAFVARGFSIVSLTLGIISFKLSKRHRKGLGYALLLLFVLGQCLIVNFPPALPRFQLLAIVIAILVVTFDFRRTRTKLVFCVSAVYFVLYIFPSIKDLRKVFSNEFEQQSNQIAYLQTSDFDAFKQIIDTTIFFSDSAYRWGENFVGAGLFWVPRTLWSSKPLTTGTIVSEGLGYPYINVSSPLPAEAFASFGLVGTMLILVLVGGMTARLDRVSLLPNAPIAFATYAIAAGYSTILMRGALNAVAPMIFPAFVVLAVTSLILNRVSRGKRSRRPKIAQGTDYEAARVALGIVPS